MQQSGGHEMGLIVRGSLSEGLTMKLAADSSVETVRAGKFVVVAGERQTYFCLITDVALGATDARVLVDPPGRSETLLRRILQGTGTYGQVTLRPMLMLENAAAGEMTTAGPDDLRPVKTIPSHFCPVFEATEEDVARIFGSEDVAIAGSEEAARRFFHIGEPLDMETPVCLNLDRFIERSSGIFGKSGTGKTFLTRIALCGILKSRKAVNLIFDMHSEYGWTGTYEGDRSSVRGLKQYFPSQVQIFTMDRESARRRRVSVDFEVRIPYSQVEPEDILLLASELNLTATAAETTYLLHGVYRDRWLEAFLDMDGAGLAAFAEQNNGNVNALSALQRRLKMMAGACPFLVKALPGEDDAVRAILSRLDSGVSVVLEFGPDGRTLPYMLVANILTRRLHAAYVDKKERAQGDKALEPTPLVITVEEAHKFLAPGLVDQTIFGTIARELRKYNVTILLVDQRPSGIDDEVLSQVGTRMTCLLNDDKDIDAVLTGVSGAKELKGVLASLDSKQQALVLGHAVPMPVVIKTRTYDDDAFRRAMGGFSSAMRSNLSLAAPPSTSENALTSEEPQETKDEKKRREQTMELDFA
jgi:DNA helicase HerA-like ATPase